jgi:hypothetical protein
MLKNLNDSDMSELEREFELEMEEDPELEWESDLDEELESSREYEEEGLEEEFEALDEEGTDYAERFYELSQREYESEAEIDQEINGILNEMERDFLFGGIRKWAKKRGGALLKRAAKYAAGQIPAFQALKGITQLARGDLKGLLASLAKAGIGSAIPGAPAALQALGFEASEDSEVNRDAWNNYVDVAREAYRHLADNMNEQSDNPLEASRQATAAFQTAMRQVRARVPSVRSRTGFASIRSRRGVRVIRVRPGERIVIEVTKGR